MSQFSGIQTNFSSGEISPSMYGRVDIQRYGNGAATIENFFIPPQGGLVRRPGSEFIKEVKNSAKTTILVPFEFSTLQAYTLEFGDYVMRVFKDEGIVESAPGVPLEVVTPWAHTDLALLRWTQSADLLFITHPNFQTRIITRTSHTAWSISTYTNVDGPYMDVSTVDCTMALQSIAITEKITSSSNEFVVGDVGKYIEYEKDGLPALGLISAVVDGFNCNITPQEHVLEPFPLEVTAVSLAAGVLTLSHGVFDRSMVGALVKVIGTAAPGWYLITAYDGTNRYVCSVGGILTLHANVGTMTPHDRVDTATLVASVDTFAATDVGRHVRLSLSGYWIWCKITAYSTAKSVSVTLGWPIPLSDSDVTRFRDGAKTKTFRLGAWCTTTGWPICVVIHEQRLVFGATSSQPQTVWMTKSGDYYVHSPTAPDGTVSDDSGVTYTLGSTKVNAIRWMQSNVELLIGTNGGEWGVRASSINEAITPTNITMSEYTTFGSANSAAIRAGNSVIFLQNSGEKLRELSYDFQINSFVAKDLTLLSDHILRTGSYAVRLDYQKEPNSAILALLYDGTIAVLTYMKDQEVYAWSRIRLGGTYSTGSAVVESMSVVPGLNGEHTVYLIVKRTINGATKKYVEFIHDIFRPTTTQDKTDMFFVDSGLTYTGVATNVISGLAHLEGQTVSCVADGSVVPDVVVIGGSITISKTATVAHVGLKYRSYVRTLPMEGGGDDGTGQGKIKRIDQLTVRLMDSIGFSHGKTLAALTQVSFRKSDGVMDSSPALVTGDISLNFDQGYVEWETYYIVQDQPYPLNILALMPQMKVYTR